MTIRRALAAVVGAAVFAAPAPELAAVDPSSYVRIPGHELPPLTAQATTERRLPLQEEVLSMLEPDAGKLEGAISGRALYDGRIDPAEALAMIKAARG